MSTPTNAHAILEKELDARARQLEQVLTADVLAILSPIASGVDGAVRDAIEFRDARRARLSVVLETTGGYIEVAQRLADTMRNHYQEVEFVIPNYAMSAGTVLVMSGDAIYMDYFSVLGPIDPQVERPGGREMIPALGYLVQYERLIEKSKNGQLTTAELAFLIEKFDPAELYHYEQARELSISLLKQWLAKYKFKNWIVTETRGKPVDDALRSERASEIARALSDTQRWHSHARGISREVLRRELKLVIEDFGERPELNGAVRPYYRLLTDYMSSRGHAGAIHVPGCYTPLIRGA